MSFPGIITLCPGKGQGQRRKVKVTPRGQSKILIQIWQRNYAQHFKWDKRGARPIVFQNHLSNFKLARPKNSAILPWCQYFLMIIPVSIHRWQINDAQSFDGYRRDVTNLSWFQRFQRITPVSTFTGCYEMLHKASSSIQEVLYCSSR